MIQILKGAYSRITDELDELMEVRDYYYVNEGEALLFYTHDETFQYALADYCRWQWLCDVIRPDYTDLYQELYQHFHQRPEFFQRLYWRDFEVFVSELLKRKGYQVMLGPGRGDGGVDITFLDPKALVPSVTLVQVKQQKAPIELHAVSALLGALEDQDQKKGLFVTSSRFRPGAAAFAGRQTRRMIQLADARDLAGWSFDAAAEVGNSIKKYTSRDYILDVFGAVFPDLTGRILVTTVAEGFKDTFFPEFVVILRDTKHLCLVMQLPTQRYHDSSFSEATEIPVKSLDLYDVEPLHKIVFRVRKQFDSNGALTFHGRRNIYDLWDNTPASSLRD